MTHWKHKLVTLSGWLFTPRQADKRDFQLHCDQICQRTSQCQVLAISASCVFIVRGADRRSVWGGGFWGKLLLMASICCFHRFLYTCTRATGLQRNRVVQSMRTQEMGFIYVTPQSLRRSSPFPIGLFVSWALTNWFWSYGVMQSTVEPALLKEAPFILHQVWNCNKLISWLRFANARF